MLCAIYAYIEDNKTSVLKGLLKPETEIFEIKIK